MLIYRWRLLCIVTNGSLCNNPTNLLNIFIGNRIYILDNKKCTLKEKGWVINSKPSFNGSQQVLEYLGRYTLKIAISNYRLTNVSGTHVTFSYLDRRDGNKQKLETLEINEFIERFLQHTLPARLVKIRHFGYFAIRVKKHDLKQIKDSLGEQVIEREVRPSLEQVLLQTKGIDVKKCSNG